MPHHSAERQTVAKQIRYRLKQIQETILTDRQSIGPIKACVTGKDKGPERMPTSGWKPFSVNQRWGGFDQTTWFKISLTVPKTMRGQQVVALVRPGGESLAYVNGKPLQGLDKNRDELFLTRKAKGGERFEIALESVPSTRFDEYHHFGYADVAVFHQDVWDFYWDGMVSLNIYESLDPDFGPARTLLELLNTAVKSVDLQHVGEPAYYASIAKAARTFKRGMKDLETSTDHGKLLLAGFSHIDTAWLWPLRETRRKCGRTFSTLLDLLDRYPEFLFTCSQPVQFEWMKEHYPEQYRRIKAYVKEGRWEPLGALWCEPDCNVPSGESMVRQFLYGNRFFRKEFGYHSPIAWLPDVFGFTWSLPQIMKKAQIEAFVTTKITWSRFEEFPYDYFMWEGPDGTKMPAVIPPNNYDGAPEPKRLAKQWNEFEQKERVDEFIYTFGHGDGGGGPTMEMLEHAKRLKNVAGLPRCEYGRVTDTVMRMNAACDLDALPVWNDELYLELHRGCQTTQAHTKRNNRKCELLFRETEFLSSLALLNGGKYDQKRIYEAWKPVLTNQFHDILPGSSITEVYKQTDIDYAAAKDLAGAARGKAVAHLLSKIDTSGEGDPIVVFNTCSWIRTEPVLATLKTKGRITVLDPTGAAVPYQRVGKGEVLFEAQAVPPMGYAVYRVVKGQSPAKPAGSLKVSANRIENDYLRVRLDKKGRLASVFDKIEGREVLAKGSAGNELQFFDDRPHAHDAWEMDHNFDEIALPSTLKSMEVAEEGPLRAVIRLVHTTEKSTITQDLTLYADSPRLDFVTHADWHDRRVLLKAAFPVDVRATKATYEIQFATIERPTHRNRAADAGRFEVTAHRWADLSEGNYGVSLLNDCKYGHDIRDNVMRISLLRAPLEPDATADEGVHDFTYSLYPHDGDWRNGTVQEGAELNMPLIAVSAPNSKGALPAVDAFVSVDAENVVIDTVKRAEDSDDIIVRFYEAYGHRGDVSLTFGRTPKEVVECDLMEENPQAVKTKGANVSLYMTPYEIRTLKVTF
jgi:alpha-mannosidase